MIYKSIDCKQKMTWVVNYIVAI